METFTRVDRIKRWQESVERDVGEHELELGTVAKAATICVDLLKSLSEHTATLHSSKLQKRQIQESYATLRLWADGYGVVDGSIDIRLERSPRLRLTVLAIFIPMCASLLQGRNSLTIGISNALLTHNSNEIYQAVECGK